MKSGNSKKARGTKTFSEDDKLASHGRVRFVFFLASEEGERSGFEVCTSLILEKNTSNMMG